MSLAPGTRIGAYEIQSPLGAGGMGEVYRARDTKLGRQIAVKILPDDFLKDPARVARFQREAQALAALNHPHIAQIYGFDDTGDIHALVMELIEGPTLADRIARLLRRCLEKERKRRLPDIGVARLEIDDAIAAPAFAAANAEMSGQRRGQRAAWIAAVIAGLTAATIGALHVTERPPQPPSPIRFHVVPPADASFPSGDEPGRPQAISPDGRHIVFQVLPAGGGRAVLAIRSFDVDQSRQLPGTEDASFLFWSPDSRFIGFFADGKLNHLVIDDR